MTTVKAHEVKAMASSLNRSNANLSACKGNMELMQGLAIVERNIVEAKGMKCRSAQANESLKVALAHAEGVLKEGHARRLRASIRAHTA